MPSYDSASDFIPNFRKMNARQNLKMNRQMESDTYRKFTLFGKKFINIFLHIFALKCSTVSCIYIRWLTNMSFDRKITKWSLTSYCNDILTWLVAMIMISSLSLLLMMLVRTMSFGNRLGIKILNRGQRYANNVSFRIEFPWLEKEK